MKQLQLLMGMPITVEIRDSNATQANIERVFAYFRFIDDTFSTYKEESEISKMNRGELAEEECSDEVKTILALSEQTRQETRGYFDIQHDGIIDPSGIVKGCAIFQAAQMLKEAGFVNYYIDAGGDIQVAGLNNGNPWRIGIPNPFNRNENVKILAIIDKGVATSGNALRSQHIYNPHQQEKPFQEIVSLIVIGPKHLYCDLACDNLYRQHGAGAIAATLRWPHRRPRKIFAWEYAFTQRAAVTRERLISKKVIACL